MHGLIATLVGVELCGAEALVRGVRTIVPIAIGLIAERLDGAAQSR